MGLLSGLTSIVKDVKKREPSYTVSGNVNWCSYCGEQNRGSSKNKNSATIQSSNSTPGYLPEENKNANLKRYMHLLLLHSL